MADGDKIVKQSQGLESVTEDMEAVNGEEFVERSQELEAGDMEEAVNGDKIVKQSQELESVTEDMEAVVNNDDEFEFVKKRSQDPQELTVVTELQSGAGDMEAVNDDSSEDSENEDEEDEDRQDEENEMKLSALGKQISQNPYMYDNHTERIKILREMGDLQRLREARDEMARHFPLTEELWLDWLHDELPLVSEESERKKVEELFEKAFGDYQSVPVWLEYVQFTIGRMGETDGVVTVREAFERALTAVGIHVSLGANIWEAYREFENALCAGLLPAAGAVVSKEQEEAFTIQNQRVISLFKRQLAVPLLHMQNTVEEYKEWLGQDSLDKDTQTIFDKAWNVLQEVQPFEDKLLTSKPPNIELYQGYIQRELQSGDPARIQCIYERALKDNCLIPDLWLQYTKYLDKLKIKTQIKSAYERAVRNCPWSSQLWVNYLLAMERQNTSFDTMKELADKALSVGFSQAGDYLAVWCQYCDYLRRRIKWDENHDEPLETFRLTVETAASFLFDNYGKDGDSEAILQQTWAFIEAKFCKNQEKAREIWNQIMQSGHGAEAGHWLQYYRLERMYGDSKHCRRILQRALNSVTDWPESVTKAYINFEREEGDLEQYDSALAKCESQMERINERRSKAAEKEEALQNAKKKDQGNKKSANKHKVNLLENQATESDHVSSNSKVINKKKRKLDDGTEGGHATTVAPLADTEEPQKKKAREGEGEQPQLQQQELASDRNNHGESVQHDPSKDNVTAFVSNLDFAVEVDKLREVFQKCGEIVSIRLARNYKGKSKGFGYVEFNDSNSVLQALKLDREFIGSRPVFVSRCEDRSVGKSAPQFKYPTRLEKSKLFIKGLPFTLTKEELEAIFKEHGKIKDIRMVTYRNGSPKGIAYVEYDNETNASQAVLKTDGLIIGEHTISVAISNPPERKTPLSTRMDIPGVRVTNLGSGKKETEFRGKARTQVSLVPRALRQQAVPKTIPANSGDGKSSPESQGKKDSAAMSNDDFRKLLNR